MSPEALAEFVMNADGSGRAEVRAPDPNVHPTAPVAYCISVPKPRLLRAASA